MAIEIFQRLECEYMPQPYGIAVRPVGFSWQGPAGRLRIFDMHGSMVFDSLEAVDSPYCSEWIPQAQQQYFWSVENADGKAESTFESALEDDFSWQPAYWLSDACNPGNIGAPTSLFRTAFDAPEWIDKSRSRLYISALGLYSVKINGRNVTDNVLTPGAVDFSRRAIYQTYCVESLLQPGINQLSVELAGGWHSGLIASTGINYDRPFYVTQDAFILRLETQRTPESPWKLLCWSNRQDWQAFCQTGRCCSDIYLGEYFDATKEDGEPSQWLKEFEIPLKLEPGNNLPVRRIMELEPVSIKRYGESFIVDFGQNLSGRERITFRAGRGTKVVIKHGEMLHDDGALYIENLRRARAETVIIAPGGEFTFEPEFTFYGFRYLEISGVEDFSVKAVVLHSDLTVCSRFECSNKLLNKFMDNVLWSQRSNFLDIPTDCPQRDERRGWSGDAQVFAPTALFNMHSAAFFRKYLTDLRLCRSNDGRFPDYAPCYPYNDLSSSYGNSGWSDAGVVIPYNLYLYYGNKQLLSENAPAVYQWIDYQANDLKRRNVCSHARFKDWLNVDDPTSAEFISSAYFAYTAVLAVRIARALDDEKNLVRMQEDAALARKYFQSHFLDDSGCLREKSQCAAAMALAFELLEAEQITDAVRLLTGNIRQHGHLTTGFLGTPLLLTALSCHGELDLAYSLLESTRCPSWLYPVTQGATTIWERWNSWNQTDGFADIGMNSFNHYAYGAVAAWVYQTAAGIQPVWEYPGFRKFKLAPQPGGTLQELSLQYDSPCGLIKSAWKRTAGAIEYRFAIPAGTSADVQLPGREAMLLAAGEYSFTVQS